ncbi:hypothetical protein K493DRAFT_88585 [Basidiobolus meristosporus CBS 931.73]|uniref:PAS domain-containing protein n=1 Tax=Basidiobolus meristosporus CBS 931.73 TaxID=1314790 RepID=A0A1Y1YV89_9FUNG|nr:hypothetical protein K493DRAFT_88585 [Basidiobolus meristosporus CBS 931.73]|eukprot:ORY01921.1 hypothetical protein K493DRAFT_88585 [Basidiobolus meristosporus CBS 931.73]
MISPKVLDFFAFVEGSVEARFLYISNGVTELLGYRPDELIGQKMVDYCHPDQTSSIDLFAAFTMVRDIFLSGSTFHIKHKNGTWVHVEVMSSCCYTKRVLRFAPVDQCKPHRKVDEWFEFSLRGDVSVKNWKQSHENLLNELHQRLVRSQDIPINSEPRVCFVLERGKDHPAIIYSSPSAEFLLGIPSAELTGSQLVTFLHPEEIPVIIDRMKQVQEDSSVSTVVLHFFSPTFTWVKLDGVFWATQDSLILVVRSYKPKMHQRPWRFLLDSGTDTTSEAELMEFAAETE